MSDLNKKNMGHNLNGATSNTVDHQLDSRKSFGPNSLPGPTVNQIANDQNIYLGRPMEHGLLVRRSPSPTKSKPPDPSSLNVSMQNASNEKDEFVDANDHGVSGGEEPDMEIVEETPLHGTGGVFG